MSVRLSLWNWPNIQHLGFVLTTLLEVQWVYSGHLVHLQWGTVHALHAIYSGHCSYAQPAL